MKGIVHITVLVLLQATKAVLFSDDVITFDELLKENNIEQFTVVTGEPYIYVGGKLILSCMVSPSFIDQGYTSSQIHFRKGKKTFTHDNGTDCIDMQYIHIVNTSTAQLVIQNVTEQEASAYVCLLQPCDANTMSSSNSIPGVSHDVKIQYKPQNVTNVTCVLFNCDEYFECSWQHPVPYIVDLNDTIVTSSFNSIDKSYPCHNQTFHSCRWSRVSETINSTVHIHIDVINTKTKDVASTFFPVLPKNEVKPSPPKNINIHALDENGCFNITWQQDEINCSLKKYLIFYQNSEDSRWIEIQKEYVKICGLPPFILHNFSIVCQAKYLSDPSNYSFTTPQKAPLSGPEAINGSYISEECTQESSYRNVTLFWKEVKETDKNGIIKGVIIKYNNNELFVVKDKYFTTLNLSCNYLETVKLFAKNDVGYSLKPTILTIAPYFFKVPQEVKNSFSVELTNTSSAQVIWKYDNSNDFIRFIIFWLEDPIVKGPVFWKLVPKNHTSISLSLTKPLLFKVGLVISNDSVGWTSPIEWTDCFYEPTSLPTIIEIDVMPSEDSVLIIWKKIDCNKLTKVKITGYTIHYCPVDQCNKNVKILQVSSAESSYILTQLISSTSYKLAAYARAGDKNGPMSEWKQFSTGEKFEKNLLFLLILLVLLPISIFVIWVVRHCKNSRERINKFNSDPEAYSEHLRSTVMVDMESRYPEVTILADGASPLLKQPVKKTQEYEQFYDADGESSILLKDCNQKEIHSENSTAIDRAKDSIVCTNEKKCEAPEINSEEEQVDPNKSEYSDYIKVNELYKLDSFQNSLVEDDTPVTVLSETITRDHRAQIL